MITRVVWPLHIPVLAKLALAIALLIASQYHLWSRLSSGSVFSPEFPRALIIGFNWAFGAIVLLAIFQLALDVGKLAMMALRSGVTVPDAVRYGIALLAGVLSAVGFTKRSAFRR